jgi:hypothetical protein
VRLQGGAQKKKRRRDRRKIDETQRFRSYSMRSSIIRDGWVGRIAIMACAICLIAAPVAWAAPAPVNVHWLGNSAPAVNEGVSWGVPWPKGALQPTDSLTLRSADGSSIPVQTWTTAYWPDGSVKWSGEAIAAPAGAAGPLQLSVGASAAPSQPVTCVSDATGITIDTGAMSCRILNTGSNLFEWMRVGTRTVGQNGRLILTLEDRSKLDSAGIIQQDSLVSSVTKVTLEQSGPVRAVVKIEGTHVSSRTGKKLLPFTVRLYFFAGMGQVRMVHSFVYDGNNQTDFIKGLGISVTVPFSEQPHNRHVRFAGDGAGIWGQPVMMLPGYRPSAGAEVTRDYAANLAGQRVPNMEQLSAQSRGAIQTVPVWNDFRLTQLGPDSYSIDKRTSSKASWVHVDTGNGHRSLGLAVLSDVSGGMAAAVRNFWQKYPASIDIDNGAQAAGEMKIWLWSPDGDAMDLRRYDSVDHGLPINYEDLRRPELATPYGIAHTTDLTLWAMGSVPADAQLAKMAQEAQQPPVLACTPEYYHSVPAFGSWSLPGSSTPARRWVEASITQLFDYYHGQIDERSWYGFWDYGDVMHNYDFGRHQWRYDVGGWAWLNTELMPNIYLWYSFLRTGRSDMYWMAVNMDRQSAEGDVYHIGPLAGLGSRHNVDHWGDGAKQPRMSHAGLKRMSYYLTTDERTGDLLHEVASAEIAWAWINNNGNTTGPVRVGFGTDWSSFAINWMTEWERTRDVAYHDKLLNGMKSLVVPGSPIALSDGGPMDLKTGVIATRGGGAGGSVFDMGFGTPESLNEMQLMVDYPDFWQGWLTASRRAAATGGQAMTAPRAAAYVYSKTHEAAMGQRAFDTLIGSAVRKGQDTPLATPPKYQGPDMLHPVTDPIFLGGAVGWQLHGAGSIHWALNAIETLDLAGDYLPTWEGVAPSNPPAGRGGQ